MTPACPPQPVPHATRSIGAAGAADTCDPITGMCTGNADANYDLACTTTGQHMITPTIAGTNQATCCEDDQCTCTNGNGAPRYDL